MKSTEGMRGVVPGASRIMSARIRLGSKRNPTGNVPTPPAGKGIWSVPKTFTSVANQITHFMKENFLKDEAASQTPAIQKRTIESDLCCLNDDMISRIVAQVSLFHTFSGPTDDQLINTLVGGLGAPTCSCYANATTWAQFTRFRMAHATTLLRRTST